MTISMIHLGQNFRFEHCFIDEGCMSYIKRPLADDHWQVIASNYQYTCYDQGLSKKAHATKRSAWIMKSSRLRWDVGCEKCARTFL